VRVRLPVNSDIDRLLHSGTSNDTLKENDQRILTIPNVGRLRKAPMGNLAKARKVPKALADLRHRVYRFFFEEEMLHAAGLSSQ
jgi:hypothetical protein